MQTEQPTDPSNLINKRLFFKKNRATVKYAGPLLHPITNPKIDPNLLWLGVEYEDEQKGTKPILTPL
jgi:hypothetical protein